MKKIKSLTVAVTYEITLGNVEVSDKIFEQLGIVYEGGNCHSSTAYLPVSKIPDAFEWLTYSIKEKDAYNWNYEIINFETE